MIVKSRANARLFAAVCGVRDDPNFLITFAGSCTALGLLTGSGGFIIKDLWFIANMILLGQAFYRGQG